MNMTVLPPGTILQLLYLKERLKKLTIGSFVEVGPGNGDITNLLLELGWTGVCLDLNPDTVKKVETRFKTEISEGRLKVEQGDFLESTLIKEDTDLVITCMVMEHFNDELEVQFMNHAKSCLQDNGIMIGLVPSSPANWGIEDDIAGHYRRYTFGMLDKKLSSANWTRLHYSGLTYPVSNLILPISNFLVARQEKTKLNTSMLERTKQSGNRSVLFKTYFPGFMKLFLNDIVMSPFHWLQKKFNKSPNALVIYFEASPRKL